VSPHLNSNFTSSTTSAPSAPQSASPKQTESCSQIFCFSF
jgi:hypothetical protein